MSTATLTAASTSASATGGADQLIEDRIDEACRALWWAELVRESLRTVIVVFVVLTVWVIVDQWVLSPTVLMRSLACLALLAWCVWRFVARIVPLLGSSIQPAYAARSLERDLPEMKQALTSYVTLRDQRTAPGLRSRVVRSIGSRVAGRLKTHDALPVEATGTMAWWLAAAAVLALFVGYATFSPKNTLTSVGRLMAPLASIEPPKRVSISEVLPGDADAIAGRTVDVSALVDGLRDDEPVVCRWRTTSGEQETELELDQATYRFSGAIELDHAAMGNVAYVIEAGDAKAGPFWLSVENVPVVALRSVRYEPPAYTGEVAHTSSSGAISAVDGTKVTVRATTSRAIEKASIEFNPRLLGQTVRATAGSKAMNIDETGTGLSITFPLRSARGRSSAVQYENYRISVSDAAGQTNPDPIVYPIRVIADLAPEISIVMPRKTPKNLPIDGQQVIEVHAMDPDFGLKQVHLDVRRGIDVVAEPSLWSDPDGAKGNQVTEYRFRPTEHGLRVGDVVKIAAVATDNRLVPDDSSIEPNVARTDAIELRIVESQPLPEQPDGNDGLSAPDEQPASDDSGDQQSKSDSPQQNSDSPEENTGQGTQKQEGDGGGEGSSTGKDGDSGQEGSQTGESKQEGGTTGQSGENKQPNGSGSDDQSTGGDSSQQEGAGKDGSGTGESKSDGSGDSAEGNQPSGSDPSGQSDPNEGQQEQSPAGSDQNSQQTPGEGDPSSGQPENGSNNDAPGDTGDSANDPNADGGGPPEHDGEAFERIRDYLEKKKQEQSEGSGEQGDRQQGQGDDQKDSSQGETDEGSPAGSESKPSGSETDPQQGSDGKDGSDPQQPSGSDQPPGDQTGVDQGTKPDSGDQGTKPDSGDQGTKEPDSGHQGTDGSKPKQDPGSSKPTGQEGLKDSGPTAPDGQEPDGQEPNGKPPQDPQQGTGGDNTPEGATDENRTDDSETGKQTGETGKQTGENGPDDSASGTDGKSPSGQESSTSDAEQSTDDRSTTNQDDSGQPKDKQGSGEASSDPSDKTDKRGSDQPGDTETPKPAQDKAGENRSSKPGEGTDADSSSEAKPDSNKEQSSDRGDSTASSSPPPQGTQPQSQPPEGAQASGEGTGTGEEDAPPPAPAPPDLEYTKKATDMVLDYLKETRDQPDSELLEELNWNENDLQRFADRWQRVRELDKSGLPAAEASQDVEEALRSLGMRPQASDAALQNRDKADSLRGIRDSGNRKPPPAAYRDVFEAFRRAVGRQ